MRTVNCMNVGLLLHFFGCGESPGQSNAVWNTLMVGKKYYSSSIDFAETLYAGEENPYTE